MFALHQRIYVSQGSVSLQSAHVSDLTLANGAIMARHRFVSNREQAAPSEPKMPDSLPQANHCESVRFSHSCTALTPRNPPVKETDAKERATYVLRKNRWIAATKKASTKKKTCGLPSDCNLMGNAEPLSDVCQFLAVIMSSTCGAFGSPSSITGDSSAT